MILYPNAKINLGLHVVEKRSDGFHNLETLFFPAYGLYDILEIVESERLEMFQYGLEYDGDPMDNLCIKAYNAVKRVLEEDGRSLPAVQIHLYKRIPVGAGLGGGSSDAASVIIALDEMFSLGLSRGKMLEIAAEVGSDCPFFILNVPAYAEGRGDELVPCVSESLDALFSAYEIRFVHPDIHVSTKEAYSGVVPRNMKTDVRRENLKKLLELPPEDWKDRLENDFEESVFRSYPELKEYKEKLYGDGAVYASMTGSGSTLFGIFRKSPVVIDSHCDTPGRAAEGADLNRRSGEGHVDFIRMAEGGVDASFFAIYTSNSLGSVMALKRAFSMIAAVKDNIGRSCGKVALALTPDDIIMNKNRGVRSVLLGMENGDPLNADLSFLREFYRMGIRYLTLTHAGNNEICDSCAAAEERWGGLSPFGIELLSEMNRIGMIVDVSHISDKSFYDVLERSAKPVAATHSCCRALVDVPRNMTDDMLRALAENGGVVQINFYPAFISENYAAVIRNYHKYEDMESSLRSGLVTDPAECMRMYEEIAEAKRRLASIERPSYKLIADHVDHAVSVAGVEHVGLGSDFDGIDVCPDGMEDIGCFGRILEELRSRGYGEREIAMIAGGNFMRVMRIVQQ